MEKYFSLTYFLLILTSWYKKAGFLSTRYCHKIYEPERTGMSETWFQSTLKEKMLKIRKKCWVLYDIVDKVGVNMMPLCPYVCACTPIHTHLHTHEHGGARWFIHHHPIPFYRWRSRLKVWESLVNVIQFNMEIFVAEFVSIFSFTLHCRLL